MLVVAINSDASTRAAKGPQRPVIPESERAELVAALSCTDLVTIFDTADVRHVIRALRPDVHVKGTDYTPETIPERDEVMAYGGRVAVAGDPKDHSTTELAARLRSTSLRSAAPEGPHRGASQLAQDDADASSASAAGLHEALHRLLGQRLQRQSGVGGGGEVDHGVGRLRMSPALAVHAQEEGQRRGSHRDREVHGTGVVADREPRGAHQGGQGVEIGGRCELGARGSRHHLLREGLLTGSPGHQRRASHLDQGAGGGGEGRRIDPSPAESPTGIDHREAPGADPLQQGLERRGRMRRAEAERSRDAVPSGESRCRRCATSERVSALAVTGWVWSQRTGKASGPSTGARGAARRAKIALCTLGAVQFPQSTTAS